MKCLLGRFSTSKLRGALSRSLGLISPEVLRARACAVLSVDVSGLLSRVRVPVLYLRAAEDRVVLRSSSKLVASLAPQVKVVECSAPHFLLQVLPSQSASEVSAFMGASCAL